jgi:hypothetical protein
MSNRHCVARLNTRYVPEGSFCVARMVYRNVEAHPADLILEVVLVRGSRPSEGDIGIEHLVLLVEMSNQVQLAVEHDFPADLILEVDLVRGSRPSEGDIGIEHLVLLVEMSDQVQLAVEHDFPADLILEVDLVRGSRPSEGDIGIEHLVLLVEMSNQLQLAVGHDFHENRVADTQDMQDIGHVLLDRVPPLLASVLVP